MSAISGKFAKELEAGDQQWPWENYSALQAYLQNGPSKNRSEIWGHNEWEKPSMSWYVNDRESSYKMFIIYPVGA